MSGLTRFVVFVLTMSCISCASHRPNDDAQARVPASEEGPLKQCVAIRGNGELVTAHFASLAALTEQKGLFEALAGGSSASISTFLYESILFNPLVKNCARCDDNERRARVAFLLKSLFEYVDVVKNSDEAMALLGASDLIAKLKAQGLSTGPVATPELLKEALKLKKVVSAPEVKDLINPEWLNFIQSGNPRLVGEARDALLNVGAFKADSTKVFLRPGPLDFAKVADRIGRVAQFYAGRGDFYPSAKMEKLLSRCAPLAHGQLWQQFRVAHAKDCAQPLHAMIKSYRARLIARPASTASRLDEPVGDRLHILISAAILDEAEARKIETARHAYVYGQAYEEKNLGVFDRLHFGYWSSAADAKLLEQNPQGFKDLKTQKALAMGPLTWRDVLSYSPAEPGLARFQKVRGSDRVSLAGWSDLAPVLALKNIGCAKVIYVTRKGDESPFGKDIARLLGMSPQQDRDLYDPTQSSFSLSLQNASGVWCTNWNAFTGGQLGDIERDAYRTALIPANAAAPLGCGGTAE